jgi:acetolactate synthase-1/2/3 large subunit
MKVSDYIVDFLARKNIDTVFGYMGGMVTHIADSINKNDFVKFIPVYHEQTAAFAAVGYARHTNNVGVAIATSGPGATNLMTGIADAFFDSAPTIFITGQVNTYEYKYDKPLRQTGFQELDVVSSVKPYTKYAKMIDKIEDIPYQLELAYNIATSGRKGPVVLDLPMNIQRGILPEDCLLESITTKNLDLVDLSEIKALLATATRPLVLVGGGVASASATKQMQDFLNNTAIPFVSSLHGKNVCDEYSLNYIGSIGSYGNRCANMAMANTDLLLVFGSRLDVRQIGGVPDSIAIGGNIVHFDIDIHELEYSRLQPKINVHIDLITALQQLTKWNINLDLTAWSSYLQTLKNKYSQANEIVKSIDDTSPYELIDILNRNTETDAIYCADVGQNQMWSMQMLKLKIQQNFYTSGGLGSMGCCLPLSIGISFADKCKRSIYAICGDGGFHMSTQSLLLISQYNLPIKVIVINNKSLGMITQFQELYFDNVTIGTNEQGGYLVPDLEFMAKSYGLKYLKYDTTDSKSSIKNKITDFFNSRNCLFEYVIAEDCRVYPKLEYNQPIYNPSPILTNDELEANMYVSLKKSADHE